MAKHRRSSQPGSRSRPFAYAGIALAAATIFALGYFAGGGATSPRPQEAVTPAEPKPPVDAPLKAQLENSSVSMPKMHVLDEVSEMESALGLTTALGANAAPSIDGAISASTAARAGKHVRPLARRLAAIEALAARYADVRRWRDAAPLWRVALTLRGVTSGSGAVVVGTDATTRPAAATGSAVEGLARLGAALQDAGDYAGALTALQEAAELLAPGRGAGGIAPATAGALAVLLTMQATVHMCAGDAVLALERFEASRRLRTALEAGPPSDAGAAARRAAAAARSDEELATDMLMHIDLLRRAAAVPGAPPDATAAMRAAAAADVRALLATGPWMFPDQLPKTYIRGLAARPWHDVALHFGGSLIPVAEALASAAPALAAEFSALASKGALVREHECIHDAGDWRHLSVNHPALRLDGEGCAVDTPVACAALRSVVAAAPPTGFHVLRGGYSSISARGHLQPHCGSTNGQLKMHVGLIVPRDTAGQPCARLRVGNETRAWEQGRVLFFDDSFEHEVWNDCDATRAIFQLVFVHPDAATRATDRAGALGH